ncbi:hypothetical protein ACFFRR_008981 [Megaselia abdita]
MVSMKSASCFWWRQPAATTEQPTVRQMPIGYFRTYSYQPLNYGGFGYNWPSNIYSNEVGYPLGNQDLVKPAEETTTTTTTTTTPRPTTTTTTTTEKPTTTSAPIFQQSPPVNQYMPFNRVQQQIPTYFRNSQQLQQDFQAYMQYLAFTQMSQSQMSQNQRGQIQFVPCMCPVTMGNGQQRPSYSNDFLENRENIDESDVPLEEVKEEPSETPQSSEENTPTNIHLTSQKENGPIQENVV